MLDDRRLSANALFWITFWITATGRGLGAKVRGPRTVSRRSRGLVRGLLGLFAGSRSNWFEGWGVCWPDLRLGLRAGGGSEGKILTANSLEITSGRFDIPWVGRPADDFKIIISQRNKCMK